MKGLWLCVVLLAFTTIATAADPFVGTYRLNVAQSKSSDAQPFPLAATLTISEDGDNLVLAISLQSSNGSTLEKTSVPKGGGLLRRVDGGDRACCRSHRPASGRVRPDVSELRQKLGPVRPYRSPTKSGTGCEYSTELMIAKPDHSDQAAA